MAFAQHEDFPHCSCKGTIIPELGPVPLSNVSAKVTFSPTSFQVGPGQSQTISVSFTLPSSIPESRLPVYSGFIEVTGASVSDTYHVSYIGSKGSLKNVEVIDDTDYFFGVPTPVILDNTGDIQSAPTNYTFKDGDFPGILFRLIHVALVVFWLDKLNNSLDSRSVHPTSVSTLLIPISSSPRQSHPRSRVGEPTQTSLLSLASLTPMKAPLRPSISLVQLQSGTM